MFASPLALSCYAPPRAQPPPARNETSAYYLLARRPDPPAEGGDRFRRLRASARADFVTSRRRAPPFRKEST